MDIETLILQLTNNYSKAIHIDVIKNYPELSWGKNGLGDRWLCKKYNYSVIYNGGKYKTYSSNENEIIPSNEISRIILISKCYRGIIGIFVHSKRLNYLKRQINKHIMNIIKKKACVICGTSTDIICDHKNDLYNDDRLENINEQMLCDFQPLCLHCNLRKRQVCKIEKDSKKLFSAKNIPQYEIYDFEFPWEKKAYVIDDIDCKKDTYWHDPIEFNNKIFRYCLFVLPIVHEIKKRNKIH